MIKGKNSVLSYFDQINEANDRNVIHFAIFKKGKVETGNTIYRTPMVPDWSFEKAREALSRVLDLQQFGEFTLISNSDQKVSNRGRFEQDFSISTSDLPAVSGFPGGPVFTSPEDIDKKIQDGVIAGIEKYKGEEERKRIEARLKELEKENKELKTSSESGWNKFLNVLSPYLPNILEEQGLIKTRVAGVPNSEAQPKTNMEKNSTSELTEEQSEEINRRVTEAVGKIAEARPDDWLVLLEKVADLIQLKPSLGDKIDMLKNFL